MKTLNKATICLATLAAIAVTVIANANIRPLNAVSVASIPSVTITAHKMSEQEKIAYDIAQSGLAMQTVVIEAKRLNPEQKLAMNQVDSKILQNKLNAHKKSALVI